MLQRDYPDQVCSVARSLEVIGERWTLLILRDAIVGMGRFEEFQESLGIASNVLAERLKLLCDENVLKRVPNPERPGRPRLRPHRERPGTRARPPGPDEVG